MRSNPAAIACDIIAGASRAATTNIDAVRPASAVLHATDAAPRRNRVAWLRAASARGHRIRLADLLGHTA
ncbi:MAG: hypothetical protein IPL43_06555 [Micropruina sp.]|nr:hypothetical protein [Micropruina sp.]